jgi:hypothetical protein
MRSLVRKSVVRRGQLVFAAAACLSTLLLLFLWVLPAWHAYRALEDVICTPEAPRLDACPCNADAW